MTLLTLCEWLQQTDTGTAIRESAWVFPIIETTHVLGLAWSVGLLFAYDLRLVGLAFRGRRVTELSQQLLPWVVGGFVVMGVSGALLFWSQPVKAYDSWFFRTKLALILLAALNAAFYHATIFRRMRDWDTLGTPPPAARLSGWMSLVLWAGVIAAGRAMAYTL